jgi:DNA invertase Pin-like site-specific DNA recombinase
MEERMLIGYARTSTADQVAGLSAQIRDLEAAGCEKVFSERVSSVARRDQFNAAMAFIREGDTLMVTKLDRLARSMADLMRITEAIGEKGAALKVLDLNLDTSTPTGALMFNVLGALAQFERQIMLERQLEGINKAKADRKYKGRAPTARPKHDEAVRLYSELGSVTKVAERLGIGRASVYRALDEAGVR